MDGPLVRTPSLFTSQTLGIHDVEFSHVWIFPDVGEARCHFLWIASCKEDHELSVRVPCVELKVKGCFFRTFQQHKRGLNASLATLPSTLKVLRSAPAHVTRLGKMSRFLRHFTTVGDEQNSQWQDEELQDSSADFEVSSGDELGQVSCRDSLRRLYKSERFQIVVVCLVVLDAIFVLCELLIDLSIIEADQHNVAPQIFHYLSLSLLTFFMVELFGKIFAFRVEFFRHKFEVFDGIVVTVSFIMDIVYVSKEHVFDAVGLLILLRLWRVARIINGIMMSVKNRAHHKVHKLKLINENLVHQVNELKELNTKTEQENARLRALLKQHSIEF